MFVIFASFTLFIVLSHAYAGLPHLDRNVTALVPTVITIHSTVTKAGVYTFQPARVMTAEGPTVLDYVGPDCKTTTWPHGQKPPPPSCYPSTITKTTPWGTKTITETKTWGAKTITETKPSGTKTVTTTKPWGTKTVTQPWGTKTVTKTWGAKTVTITKEHTKTTTAALITITVPGITTTVTKIARTTDTETKTATKTVTKKVSCPTPVESCSHIKPGCTSTGWNVDYYANPFAGYGYDGSGLGPGYYILEGLTPLNTSTTNLTYFPQNTDPSGDPVVYPGTNFDNGDAPYYVGFTRDDTAGMTVDANNFTLVYSGLYKAPASGPFQICSEADNIVDVFFGSKGGAFPCGGSPSSDASPSISGGVATGGNYNNPSTCFNETLKKGAYYPLRFVMANFQGPSALGFTIQPPGGAATDDFTGLIYPPSCAAAH